MQHIATCKSFSAARLKVSFLSASNSSRKYTDQYFASHTIFMNLTPKKAWNKLYRLSRRKCKCHVQHCNPLSQDSTMGRRQIDICLRCVVWPKMVSRVGYRQDKRCALKQKIACHHWSSR